jgi:tRNA threonylcarbamoyladenosine biosynthesis protein TsaB
LRILTIETSTPTERVAIVHDGEILAGRTEAVGRGHTERLLGIVEAVLDRSGSVLGDLDAVAVSIGPGRFSGLRVGLATAKGLAAASGLPVVPVPTLEALAESARPRTGLVCAMLDARRGEVYAALFLLDGGRDRLLPDLALPPIEMALRVAEIARDQRVICLGSGAVEYGTQIAGAAEGSSFEFVDAIDGPTPSSMAALVEATVGSAGLPAVEDAAVLEPVYLRGI